MAGIHCAIAGGTGVRNIIASGGIEQTYTVGNVTYRSHTFLSGGNFEVTFAGISPLNSIEYLVVGGGGGGGGSTSGDDGNNGGSGGGGAGGVRVGSLTASAGTFSVVIGAGGAAGGSTRGANGANSSALSVTATGGGGGGGGTSGSSLTGAAGGSGGGGRGIRYDGVWADQARQGKVAARA
jgi:hypothetical protein